jgi:hypothetical protein
VDGPSLYAIDTVAKLAMQALGDLAGSLVGERENADSGRFDSQRLDQIADTLDETECLPRAWAGEDE